MPAKEKVCARPPTPWAEWVHQIHAAGGESSSTTMAMVFVRWFVLFVWFLTRDLSVGRVLPTWSVTKWATHACTIWPGGHFSPAQLCRWYLICVYLPDLQFLCEQVRSHGASIGWFVNPRKTRLLTSCNVTSILVLLLTILPWRTYSQLPLHRSQQHLILPTKLHPISLLSSQLVLDFLVSPLGLLTLPPISLLAASMTSKNIQLYYCLTI